ncbi:hypothetical protein BaRGS_00008201, partial [Batillaria attramentaria]
MGVSTVTAARIYKGQRNGQPGEETKFNFEQFPHVALSKTYNTDRQTPDSAGTGTAFLGGVKSSYGTLGVDSRVTRGDCAMMDDDSVHVTNIFDWSIAANKSTGIVTTSRITHATPAAAYAKTPERYWEADYDMVGVADKCVKDIAQQLVANALDIQVLMGGGRKAFQDRLDGADFTQEWLTKQRDAGRNARYIQNMGDFRNLSTSDTDYVLGLFSDSHMSYDLQRNPDEEPSLAEMTEKAIRVLQKNDKGYFLMVEGARIDHAHHLNMAKMALSETIALDDAVKVAKDMTGDDTLIVVTADHSHVFNIAGYPKRGNDILGPVEPMKATSDGLPYATLVYGNGPGPGRRDLTGLDMSGDDFQQSRLVPLVGKETHGGEDVAIYARGPMAHLFHGVHEQNYIAHAMGYASCVGPNLLHCQQPE